MARDVVIQHEQSNDLQADQRLILLHQVIQEGIRQARHSADQALELPDCNGQSTTSAIVGLSGASFLLFGVMQRTPESLYINDFRGSLHL
jgi:hypothetical protein